MNNTIRIAIGVLLIVVLGVTAWLWATAGRETTDDAQVDAHVTPVAARVGGTVTEVSVKENQQVESGAVLVAIDPRDYQVALDKARAELATAEADAAAARVNVPITSTTATGNVSTARGGVEQALAQAYRERPDYLAALERVKSAEASRAAAFSELLPSVRFNADYGALGLKASDTVGTYSLAGSVNIPIFQGGRTQGRIAQADSDLRKRRAEAEDMRALIYYDVRAAFLDLQATGEELQVATRLRELANQELTQARDRFAAGVANNIEVVQAQQSVTSAEEQYIDALLGSDVAKGMLARSLGDAEAAVQRILGPGNP